MSRAQTPVRVRAGRAEGSANVKGFPSIDNHSKPSHEKVRNLSFDANIIPFKTNSQNHSAIKRKNSPFKLLEQIEPKANIFKDPRNEFNFALNTHAVSYNPQDMSPFLHKNSKNGSNENLHYRRLINFYYKPGHEKNLLSKHAHEAALRTESEYDEQIALEVQKENERLSRRVAELEEKQKKIMQSLQAKYKSESDDVHSLYQIFYIDEYKKEISDLQQMVHQLRLKNNSLSNKNETIEKENQELRVLINTYRKLIIDNRINDDLSPKAKKNLDTEANSTSIVLSSITQTKGGFGVIDVGLYDKLSSLLKSFSKHNTITSTLQSAVAEACKLFECGYARVLIINDKIKRLYKKAGGLTSEKFTFGAQEIDIIEKKEVNMVDEAKLNMAEHIDQLKRVINNEGKALSCPIYSQCSKNELLGVLQISEPLTQNSNKMKRKRGFIIKDELLLDFFTKLFGLMIDCNYFQENMKLNVEKIKQYTDAMNYVVSSKTHQEMLYAAQKSLTKYFRFENLGILFFEKKDNFMYTFDTHRQASGAFFTIQPLKYPTRLGITGYCFMNDVEAMYSNDPRKNKYFQPEIDNTTGASIVRNILVGLLYDERGNKTGLIQLVNKENNEDIDPNDELNIKEVSKLLGCLISHTDQISTTINLTYALHQTMHNIEKSIATQDKKEY